MLHRLSIGCRFRVSALRYVPAFIFLPVLLCAGAVCADAKPAAVLRGCGGVAVAFSKDGSKILTAGKDSARVWDGRTFAAVTEPMRHGGEIVFAELSANGKRVLTAGADRIARLWDADTGKPRASIATGDEIHSAAISPDGTKVATGGSRDLAVVWDVPMGKRICQLHVVASQYKADKTPVAVGFLSFTPDGGGILALRAGEGGYLFDARTGQERINRYWDDGPGWGVSPVRPAAFSPDGKLAVSIGNSWLLVVWNTQSKRAVCSLDGRDGEDGASMGWPKVVAFAPDGKTFAGVGTSVGVWKAHDGHAELVSDAFPSVKGARDLVFSPDGKRYLLAAIGDDAGVYDVQSGQQVLRVANKGETPVVAYAPDGKHVAAAFRLDDYTTIWRVPVR